MKGSGLSNTLKKTYKKLFKAFSRQYWWPGRTQFEIIVGAILTQNTAWTNVEKAIKNLKKAKVLYPRKMHDLSERELAKLIRPAGYFNIKAKRLKHFLNYLFDKYSGRLDKLFKKRTDKLRRELLLVNGVGMETADSILLYAGSHPIFVVDTYTKRILSRHMIISEDANYDEIQDIFMKNLPHDVKIFNEYHALFVKLGKDFCRNRKPLCSKCPMM
ncbi:MAG: endonuclease [Deltaproteobacteria bacterium GWC2_42_11]|nr:MAG: endonuclease [Deltaproteobacteria bacterium GWC2_42_11]HBO84515.1 endonuclease [Deltaproteobacteria bacterium]